MPGDRIEQHGRLRPEPPLDDVAIVVHGGRDTLDKIRRHALRTARAWSLDGQPLLGMLVFAVVDTSLDQLLAQRLATFRTVYLPIAGQPRAAGFPLLATGLRPHFTVQLTAGSDAEIRALVAALGDPRDNPAYAARTVWRRKD